MVEIRLGNKKFSRERLILLDQMYRIWINSNILLILFYLLKFFDYEYPKSIIQSIFINNQSV